MSWLDRLLSGGYATIQNAGTPLAPETTLNFVGVTVVDDPGNGRTTVTFSGGNPTMGGDVTGTASAAVVVAITGASGVVPVRAALQGDHTTLFPFSFKQSTLSLSSDANHTLSATEYETPGIKVTSSVSLTATRTMQLPSNTGAAFFVENATTGGQALTFKAATGAGITVPNGSFAIVYFDGTNYVSETSITVNGASVPAAGALTTGNVLQVSGASALTYAALNLAGGTSFVSGVLPKTNLDPSFTLQAGSDATVNANANSFVIMPTLTAARQVNLPASPADGNFVGVFITNGIAFPVTVSGNGHNINNGFDTPASTDALVNDGETRWYVYNSANTEWKLSTRRGSYVPPLYRSPNTRFSPTALYTFNGVITDSAGSARDLANLVGSTQYGWIEARANGLALNGSTAIRRTTRTSALDSVSSLSISFAFRPTVDGAAGRKWLLYYGNTAALAGTSANDETLYAVAWEQAATGAAVGYGTLTFAWETSAGTDEIAHFVTLIPTFRTTHITLVRTSAAHALLFVDGIQMEDINVGTLPSAIGGSPTQVLTVGGDGTPTTSANFFTGGIQGLQIIVGTELSVTQAFQVYARVAGPF